MNEGKLDIVYCIDFKLSNKLPDDVKLAFRPIRSDGLKPQYADRLDSALCDMMRLTDTRILKVVEVKYLVEPVEEKNHEMTETDWDALAEYDENKEFEEIAGLWGYSSTKSAVGEEEFIE